MSDPAERLPYRPLPPSEDERRLEWRAIFARRVVVVALSLYLLCTLALTAYVVVVIRLNQVDGRTVLDRVKSCTTPGRDCYERGQRQTGRAVADINRVAVYAAACADRPGDQSAAEIQACVMKRLAKDQEPTP